MVTWSLMRALKPSSGKKDSIFNKWCWHNWQLTCRRMRTDPFLSPCTKVKSKWIKELHIKPETLKLIEEKVGKSLEDMGTGEKFLNRTAMACAVRSRIDKWDLIKLQSFCKAKDTVNKTKRPPQESPVWALDEGPVAAIPDGPEPPPAFIQVLSNLTGSGTSAFKFLKNKFPFMHVCIHIHIHGSCVAVGGQFAGVGSWSSV